MRITGGQFKGRVITSSPGNHVRPTTDMAREAIMNVISHSVDLEKTHLLDLFSGTGIIALELLSRNIATATSVDKHPQSIKFIKSLSEQFETNDKWNWHQQDALAFCKHHINPLFNLVFCDPPYQWNQHQQLLELLYHQLSPDSLIVMEHAKTLQLPLPNNSRQRHYGQSTFSFVWVA